MHLLRVVEYSKTVLLEQLSSRYTHGVTANQIIYIDSPPCSASPPLCIYNKQDYKKSHTKSMITTSVSTGRFVFTFKSIIPILYEATHYGSNHHFVKMFDFCTTWAVIGVFHNSQTVCFMTMNPLCRNL